MSVISTSRSRSLPKGRAGLTVAAGEPDCAAGDKAGIGLFSTDAAAFGDDAAGSGVLIWVPCWTAATAGALPKEVAASLAHETSCQAPITASTTTIPRVT